MDLGGSNKLIRNTYGRSLTFRFWNVGSYSGINNTNISFNGKSLKLQSTNGMNVTMINCTNPETGERTRAFTFENGEGRGAVIQGFTITGGSADRGGCMHIINGSPTISECLFFDCRATTGIAWGGAIYSYGNPDPGPLINNTAFIYNWATEGAGVYIGGNSKMTIDNSLFEWGISPSATGRGGGICSDVANVTVTNTRLLNNNVGFGGGAVMLERSTGVFDRVSFFNNSAGSFGGAVLLFGADMKISNSELTYNKGLIFAGGVIITSSSYEAFNTIHNHNYGRGSGGAVQLVGGKLRLKQCQMNDNLSGGDGAGLFITNQKELGAVFTDAVVEESEIMNNIAKRRSGGFHFDAYDRILFREVMVANNTAERGGGGGCDAGSQSPSNFESVIFDNNRASIGGGMYLAAPCKMNFTTSIFRRNNAIDAGAGLAISDGVEVEISRSLFDQNGSPLCGTDDIPNIGGGLMIGVEEFDVNGQCNITGQTEISTINIRNSSIVGNFAKESGGGILIRQGQLNLQVSSTSFSRITWITKSLFRCQPSSLLGSLYSFFLNALVKLHHSRRLRSWVIRLLVSQIGQRKELEAVWQSKKPVRIQVHARRLLLAFPNVVFQITKHWLLEEDCFLTEDRKRVGSS